MGLIDAKFGLVAGERYRTAAPLDQDLLRVDQLVTPGVKQVGFSVRKGEILGITGLADSGRNELAMALTGVSPATSGTIAIEGSAISVRSPADAISHGIGYVPEDRLAEGLFLDKSILENQIALIVRRLCNAFGLIDKVEGRRR